MHISNALISCFLLLSAGLTSVTATKLPANGRVLQTFGPGDFLENIIVRSSGHLLVTTFNGGGLYNLNPEEPFIEAVATLPNVTGLTGIQEVSSDVFIVTGGDIDLTTLSFAQGSIQVFRVDLGRTGSVESSSIEVIASAPDRTFLNGMTRIPRNPGVVLSADSHRGEIVRINLHTGAIETVITDPFLLPNAEVMPLGVNGIEVFADYLYFTNSGKGVFGRIPINTDGTAAGAIEMLATLPGGASTTRVYDDFELITECGKVVAAYIATQDDSLTHINMSNMVQTVVYGGQNSTSLLFPTSLALSRDRERAYVVTGSSTESSGGGQIVEVAIGSG